MNMYENDMRKKPLKKSVDRPPKDFISTIFFNFTSFQNRVG